MLVEDAVSKFCHGGDVFMIILRDHQILLSRKRSWQTAIQWFSLFSRCRKVQRILLGTALFWYSTLFLLIPIIAGIICIAIAASWHDRASKFSFMAFVFVAIIAKPMSSGLFSLLLYSGVLYNSVSWLSYVMWFCEMLSIVLLVIFAASVRFAFAETAAIRKESPKELTERPTSGPVWNTALDARQIGLISTKRNLAFLVDSLPLMLACVAGVYSAGIMGDGVNSGPSVGGSAIILGFFVMAFVGPVYMILKDVVRGRSFGKSFFDCRVVTQSTGQPAKFSEALLRNLIFIVPFAAIVELIVSMVRSDGRRLGDLMAQTQVVFGPPELIDGIAVAAEVEDQRHPLDD